MANETSSIIERFGDVQVRARVALPTTVLTLDRLAGLAPGDIVSLPLSTSTHAELLVNGYILAGGEVVISGGHRALAIQELL